MNVIVTTAKVDILSVSLCLFTPGFHKVSFHTVTTSAKIH